MLRRIAFGVVACVLVATAATAGEFNFGFGANSNASAKDVGLPVYPGARPYKDKDDEGSAKVWGAFGGFGMKIAAVKLQSDGAPGKIAPFYVAALSKYGPVLDCSAGKPWPPKADKNSHRLDCSDDHPKPGEIVLKVGSKEDFRVVGIEPQGRGATISLVSIQIRGAN